MTATKARNPAFDIARGYLILLVLIGHLVLGLISDQIVRYAIYSFHMPLFIMLTGYLINLEKLRSAPIWKSAWRYWLRMAVPFIPAFLFFTGVLIAHAAFENRLDAKLLIDYLTTPYYHLWFVPTVLIWVGLLAIVVKLRLPLWIVAIVSFPLPLIWAGLDLVTMPTILIDKKLFFYAFFFLLGLLLRRYSNLWFGAITRFRYALWVLLIVLATLVLVHFGKVNSSLSAVIWFSFNILLGIASLQWCLAYMSQPAMKQSATVLSQHDSLLADLGRLSLPIYLWHVVPMFILKGLGIHQTLAVLYYFLSVIFMLALIWCVIRFEGRSALLDRWFYGVARTS